jgi:hypothetical protein
VKLALFESENNLCKLAGNANTFYVLQANNIGLSRCTQSDKVLYEISFEIFALMLHWAGVLG